MASNNAITVPNAASRLFKEKGLPRRAYVTLLSGNTDDWKGVQGLARGLRKVKSMYSLVVAVLPDVPLEHRKMLEDSGCILKEIQPVYPLGQHAQLTSTFPFVSNYSKLCIWQFEEYSKMIYLEGDTQVCANIDDLFDYRDGRIHAPLDCSCTGSGSHLLYALCPESSRWPTELGPKPILYYYGASMFVFEPSASIFHGLLNMLRRITGLQLIPFAEQYVFNMFFGEKLNPFSGYIYDELTMVTEKKNIAHLEAVKVIRYGSPGLKPWRCTPEMENMEFVNKLKRKWKDTYNDPSLDSQKQKSVKTQNLLAFLSGSASASGTK